MCKLRGLSGGARLGPTETRAQVRKACAPADKGSKINRVNSKIKLIKSPESNFDIDILLSLIHI